MKLYLYRLYQLMKIRCYILFSTLLKESYVSKIVSIWFTVRVDPLDKSHDIIRFKNKNNYLGFTIVDSTNEKSRRAIAWFYRNYDSPNINEWNKFLNMFNITKIPEHKLIFWDKNERITDFFVTVFEITNSHIKYSYNDNEPITIPIESGTLLPDKYIYNYLLYTK